MIALVAQLAAPPTGGRPPECAASEGPRGANVWERAKSPALRRYCDLLASGASKLASGGAMAADVLTIADEADRALPGRAAPSVLRGRAAARLGRWADAYAAMRTARARDERATDDPAALFAWARIALRTAHTDEAREAYRAVLPRASALPAVDRGAAYVEAGLLAMARGPAGLEEAIAVFREGRRDAQDAAQVICALGLALALDRAGEHDEARAVASERVHTDPRAMITDARGQKLVAPVFEAETDALAAMGLEAVDPALAREAWRRYAESGAAWTDHARAREAALSGRRAAAVDGGRPR